MLTDRDKAAQRIITRYGAAAFHAGKTCMDNPYAEHQPQYRLWWSEGFDTARVEMALAATIAKANP